MNDRLVIIPNEAATRNRIMKQAKRTSALSRACGFSKPAKYNDFYKWCYEHKLLVVNVNKR